MTYDDHLKPPAGQVGDKGLPFRTSFTSRIHWLVQLNHLVIPSLHRCRPRAVGRDVTIPYIDHFIHPKPLRAITKHQPSSTKIDRHHFIHAALAPLWHPPWHPLWLRGTLTRLAARAELEAARKQAHLWRRAFLMEFVTDG